MTNFWNKLFDWLERVLPSALASFAFGYRLGKKEEARISAELEKTKYALKKKINELELENGKSNEETIREFLDDPDDK